MERRLILAMASGARRFPRLLLGGAPDLNPKQDKLPKVGSASSGGPAFLSHKRALQNFLGLPQPPGRLQRPVPLERRVPCLEEAGFSNLSHTARLIVTRGSEMQAAQAGRKASVGGAQTGIREARGGNDAICFSIKCVSGGKD